MAATQAAISARCLPGLAYGCGLCPAPLPGGTARLRSPASEGSQGKKGPLSPVLAEPAHDGFWGTVPLFGERLLSEHGWLLPLSPRAGSQGPLVLRVRRASEAGGGCLDCESLELGRGGGIGKGSKGLFLLLKPSAKGLAPSYTSRCISSVCLSPRCLGAAACEGRQGRGESMDRGVEEAS